jgi:hypothetical protein
MARNTIGQVAARAVWAVAPTVVLGVCCRVHRGDRGCLLSSPHREGDAEVG